jgi:GTPase KRas
MTSCSLDMSLCYNVAVVGAGAVGKSALTIQFMQHVFCSQNDPTIEDHYRKPITIGDETIILDILDTAGQDEYLALRDQHIRSSEGFLLVFSLSSTKSFDELAATIEHILRVKDADVVPVVLVGNKSDLMAERQVSNEDINQFATKYSLPYLETSAKRRINVDECFHELALEVQKFRNRILQPVPTIHNNILQENAPHKKRKLTKHCNLL